MFGVKLGVLNKLYNMAAGGARGLFGYVKPFQPELRVKELDAYKAVYCGLCGQLGRSFGPLARLTLSYDFTFLSMLYWAVNDEQPSAERRRCYVNPFKKMAICTSGEGLSFGADAAAIMLYYKLLDNLQDGGALSRIGWTLVRPFAASARRQAAERRPGMEELVADYIARQNELERAQCPDIDAASEPTAAALGGIFGMLTEQETQRRVLERLGYLVGRFVYLSDALDDLEQDVKGGGYNPIALQHGLAAGGDWEAARQATVDSIYMTIGEAEKTLALLEMHDFIPIIENIITMGLRASVQEIRSKKELAR